MKIKCVKNVREYIIALDLKDIKDYIMHMVEEFVMKYGSDKMNIKRKILETIGQIMYWYAEIIDKFLNGTIGKAMDAYDKKEEENMIIMIDDEKCAKCNKLIDDKDFTMSTESREYWGRPSCEDICIGYKCSKCGHEEKF